ncbi:MAG TPA: anti-phage ZorAB system protein ZorA [Pseudomonadales bacterium]|nr:anti-phage ZorAB system protein ZorA [Pseudomonadales bacterium]HMW14485.1 anti-phage ZorAB system protein ZorA [Pseudomonadales bacterium]HMW82241.1 anti-phage ZorAB system protein ZorA [Pseudomonadales bacterium]HMY96044.1 anti-phage ZorAB system protein ZorA [Pseudomonadales bacterium]HMZ69925.1 anti-phage ZorAB system protein ZorA [Pseudomonadales bacterium]
MLLEFSPKFCIEPCRPIPHVDVLPGISWSMAGAMNWIEEQLQLTQAWDWILQAIQSLLTNPGLGSWVQLLLLILFSAFIAVFLFPGLFLRWRLGQIRRSLVKTKQAKNSISPADLDRLFSDDKKLLHLWEEFKDTLHAQKEERDGLIISGAWRATAPAESFFNIQSVAEGRLRTEFFKHLPGIFTGIGIIGTFSGLILGLQNFEVPDDPAKVRSSLDGLLHGVFEAFIVSATAIGLAMLVTFLEKALLASLYRCTEEIAQHLDGLFTMGAGEEYLARLVLASEDAAAQSKILKDALVGDLKVILQEMTDRQVAASAAHSEALGRQITSGIETSLQSPLEKIGEIVAKASGEQTTAATDLLKDVMASFGQRLNDLFGGQISGIQELNQKSAQAMQDAVASLNNLVGKMAENSERSGNAMADKMASAIEEMERRQAEINGQTRSLVESIRDIVSKSQNETNAELQRAVAALGAQMHEMIGALQEQATRSHEEQQQRERSFVETTSGEVGRIGESVAQVIEQMVDATEQMKRSVTLLQQVTTTSIDRLNDGAQTLERSAIAFAEAGNGVTGTLDKTTALASKLTEVSGGLTTSATALQTVLADYRANREATEMMLTQLRTVVESAKREASLTQEVLVRIETAATKLGLAQLDIEKYLDGVSEVLAQTHETFADHMTRSLDRANVDFHQKLSDAVGLLGSAIQELESTLSDLPVPRR